jgi:beta-lactam-binding protein with PASTA domain
MTLTNPPFGLAVTPNNPAVQDSWIVTLQNPSNGTEVPPGSTVFLTVEASPATCAP